MESAEACVDAPSGARRIFEQLRRGIGCCLCPASAAAAHRPRARMGVRGSGPHHWSALEALSSHLVLLIPSHRRLRHTCPSTSSRRRQPHTRRPLTRRRPELDNFRPWRSTPTRSAPSCWPAPPSPASAACGRACAPARSPRARPCAAPSAPRHAWTPPPVQEESLNRCGAGSGAAMCPASAAAAHRPRARMGVRGSGPHHWSALKRCPRTWFS